MKIGSKKKRVVWEIADKIILVDRGKGNDFRFGYPVVRKIDGREIGILL